MHDDSPRTTIRSRQLEATIDSRGAELRSLRALDGREILWPGDGLWWERSSPILFPVIGRLRNGGFRYQDHWYAMPSHGFAMHETFELCRRSRDACVWQLRSNARLRAHYPFDFMLSIGYRVNDLQLEVTACVKNTGNEVMPFSIGLHPGFCWPQGDTPRDGHWLGFEAPEPVHVRRPAASGLLGPKTGPLSIHSGRLALDETMFNGGAHVLEQVASRSVVFGNQHRPVLTVKWRNLESLGLWSLPGAPFICIEPWQGLPDADDLACDLNERSGTIHLMPGRKYGASMAIVVEPH